MIEITDISRAVNQKDDVSRKQQHTEWNPDQSCLYNLEELVEDVGQACPHQQKNYSGCNYNQQQVRVVALTWREVSYSRFPLGFTGTAPGASFERCVPHRGLRQLSTHSLAEVQISQ